jgi:hypothetical protein
MNGSLEPLGLPGPWQEPLKFVGLDPARDHALEHVGQLRFRAFPSTKDRFF